MSSNTQLMRVDTTARSNGGTTSPPRTLHGLAALRLIPSLIIVVSHFSFLHLSSNAAVDSVLFTLANPAGCNAVSFFMILSGFILAWITDNPSAINFRTFLVKRVLRVWPVHVVALTLVLAVVWRLDWAAPLNVFLVHAWVPNLDSYYSLNAPSWTLCTELVLYLLFPTLIARLTRISSGKLIAGLATLIGVVMAIPAALLLFPDGERLGNVAFVEHMQSVEVSSWKYWLVYIFPLTRLLECVIGVVVCILVRRGRWPRSVSLPAVLLVVAIALEVTVLPYLFSLSAATIVPLTLIIGAVAAKETSAESVPHLVLRFSPLGKYTFGIYMYQWLLIVLLESAFAPNSLSALESFALMAVFYLGAVSLSYFSYGTLENAVRRRTKVLLSKTSSAGKDSDVTVRARSRSRHPGDTAARVHDRPPNDVAVGQTLR